MKNKQIDFQEIDFNSKIKYDCMHKSYGRAEFIICPQYKRGILRKVFFSRLQQERKDNHFVIDLEKLGYNKTTTFHIESWSHKTDNPKIWRNCFCKEHKCVSFETYVPIGTNRIEFSYHFGDSLTIRFVGD